MLDFTRQAQIFNPEEQKLKIMIIGGGSVGSFVSLTLAKLGFKDIQLIDFDKIESHNIPNQFFRLEDVDKNKIDALKDIIKQFTGTEIQIENIKVDKNYNFDSLNLDSLVIVCVDTMNARKLIYNKIKDFPIKMIDTRMGGEGYQIYSIDLENDEEKKYYEEKLKVKTKNAPCGEKSVIYTILSIASELCNIVKKIDKNEDYPKTIKREMKGYTIIKN